MLRKQEHQQLSSTMSTRSLKPARYTCYVCQRPRSSTYHSRHPARGPPPPQGICRRCVREEEFEEHMHSPPITIFEIHHYHHDCACTQEQTRASTLVKQSPPPPAYLGCAELPAEDLRGRNNRLHRLDALERVAPPIGPKPCTRSN